ncbi:MAG: arylsulfatase [Acidobacteria bacterium]|nr:MAG: arylsulfatase [Acidobacteriota bacterium]
MRTVRRAVTFVLLILLGCRPSEPPSTRPNILLILADDMGFTDLGSFGSEIPTPNLDALAFAGMRFTNFHAAPSCGPSRAMLISGMTSWEAGVRERGGALGDHVAPLPQLLRDAGYHTYMAGKWHLGHEPAQSPRARGFESSFALVRAGDNHLGASVFPDEDVPYRENGEPVDLPDGWFSTELYTDKLLEHIRANEGDGQPWFGYLALTAPHWPHQLPEDWIDRHAGRYDSGYDVFRESRNARARELDVFPEALELEGFRGRAEAWDALDEESKSINIRSMEIYAGMVENMDFHIGRVVDYLKESGQYENTVILFFSDNGASGSDASFRTVTIPRTDTDSSLPNMGREGSFVAIGRGWAEAATAPYRDVKGSLYEGGTLAAAFVTHRSVAAPGSVDRSYLTMMDVLPTLLDLAGTRHPGVDFHGREVLPIRGRSFWPRVRGSRRPVHQEFETIPWMTTDRKAALVRGEWKIIKESRPSDPPPDWRLYQLAEDPGETEDLSARYPEVRAELVALWNEYRQGL